MLDALTSDLALNARVKDPRKLLDRALLWLHEQEVIRLHKGLAVFRPAMTIRLTDEKPGRGFAAADFEPLKLHYEGKVRQIHVMVEFARRGLEAMAEALQLAMDYFGLDEQPFLDRWLPDRDREIGRQTTPESWRHIVESLKNPVQQRIVADGREQTNVLVLAGPGSGKTRVLVHRIAYLVRVRREYREGILALAYNRHAAVEIRRRLRELIGEDAEGVTVLTCHGLAMRLAGASFSGEAGRPENEMFEGVLRRAIALLRGEGLPQEEADEQRDRLLAGFRWILVDEYQDIDGDQYELISALAGRTQEDEDRKLTLFAVGDDDQNIYAFAGASVKYIRQFEEDYKARPAYLIDNYRSTSHIIAAANALIQPARERMKDEHSIRIDRARAKSPPGGRVEQAGSGHSRPGADPVGGKSRGIPVAQALAGMKELQRLADLAPDWDWSRCAVIAREWKYLEPVRAFCELHRIPVQMGNVETPELLVSSGEPVAGRMAARARNPAGRCRRPSRLGGCTPSRTLDRAAAGSRGRACELETGEGAEVLVDHFIEWLAEWGREVRRRQRGLLLLTAHRAKGLEFDHVVVLDGGWNKVDVAQGRRLGRAAQALLRGHDPRPANPRARSFRWSAAGALHPAGLRKGVCPARVQGGGAAAICLCQNNGSVHAPRLRRPADGDAGACNSRGSTGSPVWTRSIWVFRRAPPRSAIRCIAPSPPCPPAIHWGYEWMNTGRWESGWTRSATELLAAWPKASNPHRGRGAVPPASSPS